VVAARFAWIAQTPLKLIGVFPEVMQKPHCVALVLGPKGSAEPGGIFCHTPQMIVEQLRLACFINIGTVSQEPTAANVFLTGLHRFLSGQQCRPRHHRHHR
jgi:hypothetical protein